jgi:UDP-N-acetylglucosamine--N-acetylmuramyl-(pentapeptide) pyrophosphoryl-undecaprenol N-acetylglucosamine transferase
MPEKGKTLKLDVVVLCGGTGGHFHPGLSVALEIKRRGGAVSLFLAGKHAEEQIAKAAEKGIDSEFMGSVPAPVGLLGKIRFLLHFALSFPRAWTRLGRLKPEVVLGMGGFTSIPAALAAKARGIPLYLHDGNARVGKANLALSRFARKTLIAFEPVNAERLKSPWEVVGMPLRPEIAESKFKDASRDELVEALNAEFDADFAPEKPIVLVFGGSQGAATINSTVPKVLGKLGTGDIQVVHLTGAGKLDATAAEYADAPFSRVLREFSDRMDLLLPVADLVVSRSGGSTVAELDFFAEYAVLIPLPTAADNHQEDNAKVRERAGAAAVLIESPGLELELERVFAEFAENPKSFAIRAVDAASGKHGGAALGVVEILGRRDTVGPL